MQCYISGPSFECDFEPAVSIESVCGITTRWPIYLIYPPVHFLFLRCSGNNKSGIFLSKHSSGHCPADGQFYFSKVIDTRFPTIPNIGMIQVLRKRKGTQSDFWMKLSK